MNGLWLLWRILIAFVTILQTRRYLLWSQGKDVLDKNYLFYDEKTSYIIAIFFLQICSKLKLTKQRVRCLLTARGFGKEHGSWIRLLFRVLSYKCQEKKFSLPAQGLIGMSLNCMMREAILIFIASLLSLILVSLQSLVYPFWSW